MNMNNSITIFKKGDKVVCVDSDKALGGLIEGETYTILKQTEIGYVWLEGKNHPYANSRFI